MRKDLRLGIVSDAPTLATGFGVVSRVIGDYFTQRGTTVSFLAGHPQPAKPAPTPRPGSIMHVASLDRATVELFLRRFRPGCVLFIGPATSIARWADVFRGALWRGPIAAYIACDGLPLREDLIQGLAVIDAHFAPSRCAAIYLDSRGLPMVYYAPHGADHAKFAPLAERRQLREHAGIAGRFLIGLFGRNAERKQHPRLLAAVRQLLLDGLGDRILVYLHCQPRDDEKLGGWDLARMVYDWGLQDIVAFPGATFLQHVGVPYSERISIGRISRSSHHSPLTTTFHTYSYIERLNCCDLIIDPAFSGAFELPVLEAQACGIPVAVTDDHGALAELYGPSAILLEAEKTGVWWTGAIQHFVSPKAIHGAVLRLMRSPSLGLRLSALGLANSSTYRWQNTCRLMWKVLASIT